MKSIQTASYYKTVTLPAERADDGDGVTVTIGRPALVTSNEAADTYVNAAALLGVELVVSDDTDETAEAPTIPTGGTATGPTPDLSTGVPAVTGKGAPVTTDALNTKTSAPAGTKEK